MGFESKDTQIKRRRRIRMRFRALVRKVLANAFWITELDENKIGTDVKKNIAIITKRSKERSSFLTIVEKRIINTPLEQRSNGQKETLDKAFQKLPCFSTFNPEIRSRLADVVEFRYYSKGSIIIKEFHPGAAVYFILDGEVIVTKQTFKYQNELTDEPVNLLRAGDMFGHLALLNNAKRIATCTTESILID